MKFDFWSRWGAALSDADFAAAWMALGVVAGSDVRLPASAGYLGLLERDAAAAPPDVTLLIARSAIADALSASRAHDLTVRWRFPDPAASVDRDGRFALTRIDPATWARAWAEAAAIVDVPARVRVADAPDDEPVAPWLRLLGEARPPVAAVSLVLAAPNPQLVLEWPLRLGALGASAEE